MRSRVGRNASRPIALARWARQPAPLSRDPPAARLTSPGSSGAPSRPACRGRQGRGGFRRTAPARPRGPRASGSGGSGFSIALPRSAASRKASTSAVEGNSAPGAFASLIASVALAARSFGHILRNRPFERIDVGAIELAVDCEDVADDIGLALARRLQRLDIAGLRILELLVLERELQAAARLRRGDRGGDRPRELVL